MQHPCRVAIKFLARGVFCKNLRAEITNHMMLVHPHIIEAKEVGRKEGKFTTPLAAN